MNTIAHHNISYNSCQMNISSQHKQRKKFNMQCECPQTEGAKNYS